MADKNKGGNNKSRAKGIARDVFAAYRKNRKEKEIPIQDENEDIMTDETEKIDVKPEKDSEAKKEKDEKVSAETSENDKKDLTEEDLLEIVDNYNNILKERDELKDKLIRNTAEMENIRRRTAREKQDAIIYGNEKLLDKLLPVIDDLENAVEAGKKSGEGDALLQGVEMILKKALKTFEESGVTKMKDPTGEEFDVNFHEALMQMPSDQPEGHVAQVVQPGYMIHDKVLRHAKVVTSSGSPAETEKK